MPRKTFFKKRKIRQVKKLLPVLERLCNVRSEKEMYNIVKDMNNMGLEFLCECVYNVVFNADKLFTQDQIVYLQELLQKFDEQSVICFYQFTFQKLKRQKKVSCCCKSYVLISIVLSLLLPIFKTIIYE